MSIGPVDGVKATEATDFGFTKKVNKEANADFINSVFTHKPNRNMLEGTGGIHG